MLNHIEAVTQPLAFRVVGRGGNGVPQLLGLMGDRQQMIERALRFVPQQSTWLKLWMLLQEAKRDEVRAWFDEAHAGQWQLAAPDIIFYELGNVLTRALAHVEPAALAAALEHALATVQLRRPASATTSRRGRS